MAYKKKCVFPKLGSKKHQLGKRKKNKNTLTSAERAKKLTEWKNSW